MLKEEVSVAVVAQRGVTHYVYKLASRHTFDKTLDLYVNIYENSFESR